MARPHLDLHHLEMLLAIAQEPSQAQAAAALRVTPSALSHRIREAERRLGVALYLKQGRSLRPTAAAEILTASAERLLPELQYAERLAVGAMEGIRHLIRLTVGVYNSFHWMPAFMAGMRRDHPDIDIDIEPDALHHPLENLATEKIDLVMAPGPGPGGPFEALHLFTDELVAVAAPWHGFAGRPHVSAEDFRDETLLSYSMVRQPGFEADRFWSPSGLYPAHEVKVGSVEAVCEMVKAGFGVAILSRWALRSYFDAGTLVPVQLGPVGLDIPWHAVMRVSAPRDAPERLMARRMAEWFGEGGGGSDGG